MRETLTNITDMIYANSIYARTTVSQLWAMIGAAKKQIFCEARTVATPQNSCRCWQYRKSEASSDSLTSPAHKDQWLQVSWNHFSRHFVCQRTYQLNKLRSVNYRPAFSNNSPAMYCASPLDGLVKTCPPRIGRLDWSSRFSKKANRKSRLFEAQEQSDIWIKRAQNDKTIAGVIVKLVEDTVDVQSSV